MSEISIRAATPADRPQVFSLLAACGLSSEGVDPALAGYTVAEEAAVPIGVAGLERYGRQGLLRSVAVSPQHRGRGLGAQLTGSVIAAARAAGLEGLYALTTTAESYFPRLGFEVIRREDVPAAVQASAEFTTICPSSAVALRLKLAAGPDSRSASQSARVGAGAQW